MVMGSCWGQLKSLCRGRRETARPGGEAVELSSVAVQRYARYSQPRIPVTINLFELEKLVLETLRSIPYANEDDSPVALMALNVLSDNDKDWIQVVWAIIRAIPLDHPFGPSTVNLLIDDSPIPSKTTVLELVRILELSSDRALAHDCVRIERNICLVLGCVALKLAGPHSVQILTAGTLEYLITLMMYSSSPILVLHSLLALEKFAHVTENKLNIRAVLLRDSERLMRLEEYANDNNCISRQVGFCARWVMDNLFPVPGRPLSCESVDMTGINVILDLYDVGQDLKISPDGLETRSDSSSFESVRCTFHVHEGCWYYECLIITNGVMQIGWANEHSGFVTDDAFGVGDDNFSLSYDGCRRYYWHNAQPTLVPPEVPHWQPGDIVGCLLDINAKHVVFTLNGMHVITCTELFQTLNADTSLKYYASASLMAWQQCRFNYGSQPFRYPPNRPFASLNEHAVLTDQKKRLMPKTIVLDQINETVVGEDTCLICYNNALGIVAIKPCGHGGFCNECSVRLKNCPMCRGPIHGVENA